MRKKEEQKDITRIEAVTEKVNNKMVVVASDESVDRAGDSLKVENWDLKNFKKNPVLLAGHNYRPEYVIGVAKKIWVEGKKLMFEPEFHEITALARQMKEMFEEEILKAWSVGFISKHKGEGKEEEVSYELLEVSAVAVPCNPKALVAEKSADEIKDWVGKSLDTQEEKKEIKEDAEEKEGRVLSGKNKKVVQKAMDALSAVNVVLNELLQANEGKELPIETPKVEKIEKVAPAEKQSIKPSPMFNDINREKIALRTLQIIASQVGGALNKIKK